METSIANNSVKWKAIGPGGGGAQFVPTISPHNPDVMLVRCDMTGAYITKDGGKTWRQFNLRTTVGSFAFDPVDPQIIYAGSSGLFRSIDGGQKWSLVFPDPASGIKEYMMNDEANQYFVSNDNWPGGQIQAILIDPMNTDNIYIGIYSDGSIKIFRTSDCGKTWEEFLSVEGAKIHKLHLDQTQMHARRLFIFTDRGIVEANIESREIKKPELPEAVRKILHSACGADPENGTALFYITAWTNQNKYPSIWKSADMGGSWLELQIKLDNNTYWPAGGLSREYSLLAVSDNDGRSIYAGIGGIDYSDDGGYQEPSETSASGAVISYYGVIKSLDAGESWSWVLKTDYDSSADNLKEGWVERDYGYTWYMVGPKGLGPLGLNVSPTDKDICCYTDLSSTFITRDGGRTWCQVYSDEHEDGSVSTRGMDVTTCYGVHFDPFNERHIVISYTDIGMFHSRDRGSTWFHAIENVPVEWGNTCYWMVFDPEVKGKAWSAWGGGHDVPRKKMFRTGRFHLFQGGVMRSDDGLLSWQKSNKGMSENSVTTHIILDPSSPVGKRTLYAAVCDKGVYKSTDDGHTWTLKNNGISNNLNAWKIILLPDGTLYLLIVRGLRKGVDIEGALYVSKDGAENWAKIQLPKGIDFPNDLDFDPKNPERMYLACWPEGGVEKPVSGGLYRTEDGGKSWKNIFDPYSHVYGVTIHPYNPSVIFIATFNSAAYRSDDGGNTWSRIKGFNFKWGHKAIVDPYDSEMLYITTFGSSVWHGPSKGDDYAFEDIHPY